MAFGIPGISSPSQLGTTQDAPIDQLRLTGPSYASPMPMAPDAVRRKHSPSAGTYDAHVLERIGARMHSIATSTTAATVGAAERLGPALGQLGSKVVPAAAGVARAVVPIAGEVLGTAALVLTTQRPAGESEADLAKTRTFDAAGHQRLVSMAHSAATESHHSAFPAEYFDVGPNHMESPQHIRAATDGIHSTPAETQTKPAHTGHAPPDLRELTKPTGVPVHQPKAVDQATLAKQEGIVTSAAHAAHLTPIGTLVNADKAVIDVERKIDGYALNPEHVVGGHKARVFKSALGYDRQNSQGLVHQIREGVQSQPATPGKVTPFGTQFGVDIPVTGPSGSATVRTGWNYDAGSDIPRLTTAVVRK
jgi:hypothetical protein